MKSLAARIAYGFVGAVALSLVYLFATMTLENGRDLFGQALALEKIPRVVGAAFRVLLNSVCTIGLFVFAIRLFQGAFCARKKKNA